MAKTNQTKVANLQVEVLSKYIEAMSSSAVTQEQMSVVREDTLSKLEIHHGGGVQGNEAAKRLIAAANLIYGIGGQIVSAPKGSK